MSPTRYLDAIVALSVCAPLQLVRTARYLVPAAERHERDVFRFGLPASLLLFGVLGYRLASTPYPWSGRPVWWAVGAGAGIALIGVEVAVAAAATRSIPSKVAFTDPWPDSRWVLLATTALIAIGEEAVFRGVLLGTLVHSLGWPVVPALVASAAAYAAGHTFFGRLVVLQKAVTGLGFGVLAVASGSVLAPIAAHVALNVTVTTLAGRPNPASRSGPHGLRSYRLSRLRLGGTARSAP